MSYEPTKQERIEEIKRYLMPAIAGLIVLGIAGWVTWRVYGSKTAAKPATTHAEPAMDSSRRQSLMRQVDSLEAAARKAQQEGGERAAVAVLNRAIEAQRELAASTPAGGDFSPAQKLTELETMRADLVFRAATTRSLELEREAAADRARGDTAAGMDKLREALRLQREANAAATKDDRKDSAREVALAEAVAQAGAQPKRDALDRARARATAAVAAENWTAALKAYEEAHALQLDLNSEPSLARPDLEAVTALEAEIQSIKGAELAEQLAQRTREATAAEAAGNAVEAVKSFRAAADVQQEINLKFPKSRFASAERVVEQQALADTAGSRTAVGKARNLEREATMSLRQRKFEEAREKITAARQLLASTSGEFPRSRELDPVFRRKIELLFLKHDDLPRLHEAVSAALRPLPGGENLLMLRTEVSQELYQRVMNVNPSRNLGSTLPVDSVSWLDAEEFCRRLSWLLGQRVRLPAEAEFKRASRDPEKMWSAETSFNRTREIGRLPATPEGFQDLAGNVAEWLNEPSNQSVTAGVAGGSFHDAAEAIRKAPIQRMPKETRSSAIGFRFVVENAPTEGR